MRKMNQWFVIILLFGFISCNDKVENKFVIKGKIKPAYTEYIYLEEASVSSSQPLIVDSARIEKNGSFELSTITTEENLYLVRLPGYPTPLATVVNDRERVTVDIDLDNKQKPFISKGSPASEKLNAFVYESNSKLARIYKGSQRVDSMRKANTPDSVIQVSLKQRELAAIDFKNDVIQILNGSESPALSLFVLGSYQSYASSPTLGLTPFTNQQINEMLEKLATRFPNHTGTAQLKKRFSATAAPATPDRPVLVNNPAPAFSLPDVTGKEVSLSSFKGKYLLIDFWASWCKPCRLENPNVVQAYQQFKNKNFAILGVSLDKDKEAWMKAIKDDNLSWTNVSDLKFWDSMVVPLYHIQGIPYNVLVDPNGVVIAENLRGVELSQKLTQVLK